MARRIGSRAAAALATAVVIGAPSLQAHKAVTSKFTYNDQVFPILRDQCGRCHGDGGPTPMSLTTYAATTPWAESIREQLVSEAMPPWPVDPHGPAVKGGHALTSRELDVLLTWVTGGTPQGDASKAPPPVAPPPHWPAGPPDLSLAMSAPHVLPAGQADDTYEFTLPSGQSEDKWVKAVDVRPGTRSMVRSALVSIDGGPVLGAWVAGDSPLAAPGGSAFRLPRGASLRVRIHYKKNWQDEALEQSDRSTIGLYFTDPPVTGRPIDSLVLRAPQGVGASKTPSGARLTAPARVLAFRPTLDQVYQSVQIDAVFPTGRRVNLFKLQGARPQWQRRYWLADPIELPVDTALEVTATPLSANEPGPAVPADGPFQVAVEFVPL